MTMKNSRSAPEQRVAKHIAALPKSGIRDFFELVNNMDDVVSLGVGEPDFPTPWHIREASIYGYERGHTSYTSNLGLLSLREELCRYVGRHYGVDYSPVEESIITVGVSEAMDLVLRAILNPGEQVIYHEPCFVSYSPGIKMAGAVPVPVVTCQENNFELDPADVRKAVTPGTKAIVLNFPCNPTGASMDVDSLGAIAEIAKEHDLIVITDEIYSELSYETGHCSIASLPGMRDRTVFLHGFSKAYAMTGYRIGYACGPPDIIDAMMKIHQYSMMCAPINGQEAALEALKNGWDEMCRMRDEYRRRRDLIVKHLNAMGLPCIQPKGAFYAFPNIKGTGMSSMDFSVRLLEEKNVAVVPGTAFGPSGEGFVRCSYSASADDILRAVKAIADFVKA